MLGLSYMDFPLEDGPRRSKQYCAWKDIYPSRESTQRANLSRLATTSIRMIDSGLVCTSERQTMYHKLVILLGIAVGNIATHAIMYFCQP